MLSPTGFYRPSTHTQHRPRFSGGPGDETPSTPPADSPVNSETIKQAHDSIQPPVKPHSPPVPPAKSDLGPWGTFKALLKELKDPETRNVVKGLTCKYVPEGLMTAACAIPGLGWLFNVATLPLQMWLTSYGSGALKKSEERLKKTPPDHPSYMTHYGLKHALRMDPAWNDDPHRQFFGNPEKGKKHTLSEYMVTKYNKTIKGVFHKSEKLVDKLQVMFDPKEKNIAKQPRMFRTITRWTEAQQALRQNPWLGRVFNWMSGSPFNRVIMHRFMRFFFIVPRLTLQILFFALRRKPHFG